MKGRGSSHELTQVTGVDQTKYKLLYIICEASREVTPTDTRHVSQVQWDLLPFLPLAKITDMAPLTFHQMILVASLAVVARAQRHILSPEDLRPGYDFVVVGGGTSGLTIADRLSERLVNKTVLVIEFGKSEYVPGNFDLPQTIWGGSSPGAGRWVFSSLANREVDNKQASVFSGATVGGSSAVNGMFFDRPVSF